MFGDVASTKSLTLPLLAALIIATISGCGVTNDPPPVRLNINLTGRITYDSVPHFAGSYALDYASTVAKPARGIIIEAVSAGHVIITATTNANGEYALNYNYDWLSNANTLIRVRAQIKRELGRSTQNFQVLDNTNSGAAYTIDLLTVGPGSTTSAVIDAHAPSGWGGASYTSTRTAAPFAILDKVYEAMVKARAIDRYVDFPPLNIYWSVNNIPAAGDKSLGQITTSHWDGSALYILGAENFDTDEYDGHVVLHEFGHYFESKLSRNDSIGGPHTSGDRLDMRVAFSEGWSNAFSAIVTDNPAYKDSIGAGQASGFGLDIESNTVANPGWYSEGSIQSIVYDLYDSSSDGNDGVTLGFGPIYNVMTGQHKTADGLTSIFSFIPPLKVATGQGAAIDILVGGQNIVSATMDSTGSTETNDAATAPNVLPIYTTAPTDGSAVEVCTLNKFENNAITPNRNKLSYHRFLRFTAPSTKTYAISATKTSTTSTNSTSDPDIGLYSNTGIIAVAQSATANTETLTTPTLTAGSNYVINVFDYNLVNTAASGSQSTCMDVTVN